MPINITEEFVRNLLTQIETLTAQNQALTATVAELNQTIRELKEQINKNSKNSSKPPSSDGLKKQPVNKNRSLREKTGTRVDGKTCWVHDASNRDFTYLTISEKRGRIGMDAGDVLPHFQGIIVHDCWGSYWKYPNVSHSICCAHLLRELNGVIENHPEQTWASRFKELLLNMKKVRDKALLNNKDEVSYYHIHKFDKQYDEILKIAYEENPLPTTTAKKRGRKKKSKVLNLICRLDNYKASVCLFIRNLCVPFDNNQAEHDLRMVKVKTKVSGCFRSKEGAQEYLTIMSYIGTAHKHGINAFTAILEALNGNSDIIFG